MSLRASALIREERRPGPDDSGIEAAERAIERLLVIEAAERVIERLLVQIDLRDRADQENAEWEKRLRRERLEDRMDRLIAPLMPGLIVAALKMHPEWEVMATEDVVRKFIATIDAAVGKALTT